MRTRFHAMTLETNDNHQLLNCTEGIEVLRSRLPVVPSTPHSSIHGAHLWLNRDSSQWYTVQASNISPRFTPRRARHRGSIVQHNPCNHDRYDPEASPSWQVTARHLIVIFRQCVCDVNQHVQLSSLHQLLEPQVFHLHVPHPAEAAGRRGRHCRRSVRHHEQHHLDTELQHHLLEPETPRSTLIHPPTESMTKFAAGAGQLLSTLRMWICEFARSQPNYFRPAF